MKVLLAVDDDADMRMLISIALSSDERLHLAPAPAADATTAVALATELKPDLILLDHFIEGDIMGLQAAPLLKAAAPDAKILLFTTHELSVEVSREDAVDGYLKKERLPELLPTVQRLLGIDPIASP